MASLDVDLPRIHVSYSKMADRYGHILQIKLLGQNIVMINDVDLVRLAFGSDKYCEVFNDKPSSFLGKYIFYDSSDIIFSNFSNPNKKTMTMRKMFHRALGFYGDGIAHFNQMNEDELTQVVKELKLTKQRDFDLHSVVTKSLANTLVTRHDFEAIFEWAGNGGFFFSSRGLIFDFIPIIRFLPGFFRNKYKRVMASTTKLIEMFYFAVKDDEDERDPSREKPGFVAKLIQLQSEINQTVGAEYITDNNIKGIILDTIGASQEIPSTALANIFAIMLTRPNVARKIQDEIDNKVGSSRKPNESDKKHMSYTSRIVRKPDFCLGENKGADQLRGNREADQRLCFRYTDSTIPLLLKSEISSF